MLRELSALGCPQWLLGNQIPSRWWNEMAVAAVGASDLLQQSLLLGVFLTLSLAVLGFVWFIGRRKPLQAAGARGRPESPDGPPPTVALVIPVLNEKAVLEQTVQTVRQYFREQFPYPARVMIAENGSTDGTVELAQRLAEQYDDVDCTVLSQRGRGRALRLAWAESTADIVAYTDVDLSTELEALETLCRAIHEEGYEVATGSRLLRESRVKRCFKRELISRLYNLFIKCVLFTRFSDAQCGFKAVSRRVVDQIVPVVQDQAWFFDTELLVLAEKWGYPIKDVPVRWIEDNDSRVRIVSTAWEDIKGVLRLRLFLWKHGTQQSPERSDEDASVSVAHTPAQDVPSRG